jgi:predicted Zn-dependent peptidase
MPGTAASALSGVVLERSFTDFMALLEETLTAPGLAEDELERLKRETSAELMEILDSDQQLAQRWFLAQRVRRAPLRLALRAGSHRTA